MPSRHSPILLPSEITPRSVFEGRRSFLRDAGFAVAAASIGGAAFRPGSAEAKMFEAARKSPFSVTEPATPFKDVTTYNNFYEFGTGKDDPAERAHTLKPRPWSVSVEGECAKPKRWDIEELLKLAAVEERVYRMRCVEGLRIDEAMHPLTLLTLGLYGDLLPNQNGAPVRVVVPWKYGFKSAKSIVRIRFTEQEPRTAWNKAIAREYGFYSNVNPAVDHPRWSQAKERRIGEFGKRPTLPFNGYGDQVASLYAGMDLRKYF